MINQDKLRLLTKKPPSMNFDKFTKITPIKVIPPERGSPDIEYTTPKRVMPTPEKKFIQNREIASAQLPKKPLFRESKNAYQDYDVDSSDEDNSVGAVMGSLSMNKRCITHNHSLSVPNQILLNRRASEQVFCKRTPDRDTLLKFIEYEQRIKQLEGRVSELNQQNNDLRGTVNTLLQTKF